MKDKRMFGNTEVIWNDSELDAVPEEEIQKRRKQGGKNIPLVHYEDKLRRMRSEAI